MFLNEGIMMVANAALKNDLSAPSFSLGFSQSSEEATLTQEGEPPANMKKSQDNLILVEELEELEELVEVINTRVAATLNYAKQKSPSPEKVQPTLSFLNKFKTPMRQKEITNDLKKKEFHWVTNIKTYDDGSSNEWEAIFKMKHESHLEITRMHFDSLKPN
ncbi:hypothetical protein AHAS_Ahas16G0154400 [Arachis hypogaea]